MLIEAKLTMMIAVYEWSARIKIIRNKPLINKVTQLEGDEIYPNNPNSKSSRISSQSSQPLVAKINTQLIVKPNPSDLVSSASEAVNFWKSKTYIK